MARPKSSHDYSAGIIPIGELTEELVSWINIPRATARRVAVESEKVIREIKPGEIIVLEYGDTDVAVVSNRSSFSPEKSLKWQKCGESLFLTVPHHGLQGGRVTRIFGSYTARELPTAECFRAPADATRSMLFSEGFSETELFDYVIPKRTFDRRQSKKEPLTVEETDKALRLARIADLANQVFGDKDKAQRWLRKPKRSLDGETPVAYLSSETGARVVEEMLVRIDTGMLA